jgi:hypothetical protein
MNENKNWLRCDIGIPVLFHWLVRQASGHDEIEKRVDKLENQLAKSTNGDTISDCNISTHTDYNCSPRRTVIQPMSEDGGLKLDASYRDI